MSLPSISHSNQFEILNCNYDVRVDYKHTLIALTKLESLPTKSAEQLNQLKRARLYLIEFELSLYACLQVQIDNLNQQPQHEQWYIRDNYYFLQRLTRLISFLVQNELIALPPERSHQFERLHSLLKS